MSVTEKILHHNVRETAKVIFHIDDGVVVAKYKDKVDFNLEDAKDAVELRYELQEHMSMPMLVGHMGTADVSLRARIYLAGPAGDKYVKAGAILTNSLLMFTLANTFMKLRRSKIPVRIFHDEEEAMKWLKTFR